MQTSEELTSNPPIFLSTSVTSRSTVRILFCLTFLFGRVRTGSLGLVIIIHASQRSDGRLRPASSLTEVRRATQSVCLRIRFNSTTRIDVGDTRAGACDGASSCNKSNSGSDICSHCARYPPTSFNMRSGYENISREFPHRGTTLDRRKSLINELTGRSGL